MSSYTHNEQSSLLELIPPSQLEPRQIAVTREGNELPTYKFLRTLRTIDELQPYSDGVVVSMDNNILVLLNVEIAYQKDVQHAGPLEMTFTFDDGTRTMCKIYGASYDAILETAIFFAGLRVASERKLARTTIHCYQSNDINAGHAEQVALLLDALSTKTITFEYTYLNSFLSKVLATRPYSIDLTVSPMDSDAFIEHLQSRTSLFGSLKAPSMKRANLQRLFDHLHLFEYLDVGALYNNLLLKLLAAPIKRISFAFREAPYDIEMDLTAASIVPKDIRVQVGAPDEFLARNMLSFLHRVAQLAHLETFAIHFYDHRQVSVNLGKALIDAVAASKKLSSLELVDYKYKSCFFYNNMKDLLFSLENHEGLRTLRIEYYPAQLDPTFKWLKQLLKRNRYVDVTATVFDSSTDTGKLIVDREMDELHALNRFFRGLQRLKKEPRVIRPSLVGAALTHRVASDVQRAGLLLSNHTDVFCELLIEAIPSNGADDTNVPLSADTASRNELKRKRETDS